MNVDLLDAHSQETDARKGSRQSIADSPLARIPVQAMIFAA